jgi:tetraacyldisaccharide 4'-kinase
MNCRRLKTSQESRPDSPISSKSINMENRRIFFLYPFSLVYQLITGFRNLLYDKGILHSGKFSIPVICVGNITVGGTGKTPHTEYIADLLGKEFRVAVLSRGYKRKSGGFLIADKKSSVKDIGDEPMQIYLKLPDIIMAVDRNRSNGINRIMREFPETDVIILDDGFQHRSVKPGLSVLLTDYNRLFTRDNLLPFGRLRETAGNKRRADIIIVTKTDPSISEAEINSIADELSPSTGQRLFFTTIVYDDLKPVFENTESPVRSVSLPDKSIRGVVLVTGIASTGAIKNHLGQYFTEISHISFPDHHYFVEKDFEKIQRAWEKLESDQKIIITTEKDAVRLREFTNIATVIKNSLYYLPVEVGFLKDKKHEFDSLIFSYVRKNKTNNRFP